MQKKIIFLFLILFFQTMPCFAALEISISRKEIPEGESFDLYIRQEKNDADPELSVLDKDFFIVRQHKSYKSSYINGKTEQHNENIVTLIPKKTGDVILPSIRAGKEKSTPVKLSVIPAGTASSTNASQPHQKLQSNVFIRSKIAEKTPFIGQQILYTVRLYTNPQTPLLDGSVSLARVDGITIEQWGEAKKTRETIQGISYNVYEYRYLIFPQKSGKIELPAAQFQGIISDTSQQNNQAQRGRGYDNLDNFFGFGASDMFSGFSAQKNIAVASQPIEINVQPKPLDFKAEWFPATNVEIGEALSPETQSIELEEAITRTVTILANGVRDTQIPDPVFPNSQNYNQYPGKVESKNLFDKNGIIGIKTRQIVLMPTKTGALDLPAMSIDWFDVTTKQKKTAVLPARTINVVQTQKKAQSTQSTPSEQIIAPQTKGEENALFPSESDSLEEIPVSVSQEERTSYETFAKNNPLRVFFIGLLIGGLSATLIWLLVHYFLFKRLSYIEKITTRQKETSERKRVRILREACLNGSLLEIKQALLNIAILIFPENPPMTLSDVAQRFNDKALSEEIEKLNRSLYGQESTLFDTKSFWIVFSATLTSYKKKEKENDKKSPLPPLYPK